jgi:MFS family permease
MADAEQKPAGEKHVSFAALRHKDCRWYLLGSGLAMMADNIEHVISYWIMFEKFHSPALLGFAVFSHWMPFLLFSVYAGAIADRFDPRRVIQGSMFLFMLVSLAWGVLFITDSVEVWHAGVLLVIHGFAGVLWAPASQLLVHDIVGRTQLQSAVRMLATSRTAGSLLGPGIGGALMLIFTPNIGILINALIYLPLILWLWKAPYGPKFRKDWQPPPRAVKGFADVALTFRQIVGNRTVLSMTVLAGAASLFVGNAFQAQMPEFAHDLGHAGGEADVGYSVLLAANAGGALVGGLILESRGLLPAKPSNAFILVILWCLVLTGFASTDIYPLAVGLMFVAGFLNLAFGSMGQTLAQLHAPPEIRGRVIGLYNVASMGLKSFSGVTVGIGGALVGVHWSLAMSAMVLATVATSVFAFMIRTGGTGDNETVPETPKLK